MAQGTASQKPTTRTMTVRVRSAEYLFLKELAESRGLSPSAVVSEAISEFAQLISRREAIRRINDLRTRIKQACGIGASAVELIDEAREERAEQLDAASRARRPDK